MPLAAVTVRVRLALAAAAVTRTGLAATVTVTVTLTVTQLDAGRPADRTTWCGWPSGWVDASLVVKLHEWTPTRTHCNRGPTSSESDDPTKPVVLSHLESLGLGL